MSALEDALKHPANRPAPLVRWLASEVAPSADLSGLSDAGGVFCDLRQGMEEKDPSTSVSVGRNGGAVFRRHGADDAGLSAVQYVAQVLNVSKGEAAKLLIDRAGIVEEAPHKGQKRGKLRGAVKKEALAPTPAPIGLSEALEKLEKFGPLAPSDLAYRLRGLSPLLGDDGGEAAQEITRRGLWPAVSGGVLLAYKYTGTDPQKSGPQKRYPVPAHSEAGALFFSITGPDGKAWAVKFRNTDKALSAAQAAGQKLGRYAYTGKGAGRPAWCAGPMREDLPTLLIEGELNAAAVWAMLEAAGLGAAYNVQGVASAGGLPHVAHLREGSQVYIYADLGDKRGEGDKARSMWGELAHALGAQVFQIGQHETGEAGGLPANPFAYPLGEGQGFALNADACDALGHAPPNSMPQQWAQDLGSRLKLALEAAPRWLPDPKPAAQTKDQKKQAGGVLWVSDTDGFSSQYGKLEAVKKRWHDGEEEEDFTELLNFSALIVGQITQEDGTGEAPLLFEIEGRWPNGQPMRPARLLIPASEFAAMNWPSARWGASAIVASGQGKKDKAREGIQRLSAEAGITERTVYQFTGWQMTEGGPVYLSAGAAIGGAGAVSGLEVDLSAGERLKGYALPDPAQHGEEEKREAVRQSLALLELVGLDSVSVPVLGAVYRAPLGRANFAVWLTGETGRNKTALLALAMSHYGNRWNAEHLPEGWASSANGLEKSAFTVKDALFLIDDFKPSGSTTEVSRIHGAASRILAGAADGVGRGTMTADRKARAGLYPRGLVISSGETLPRGHSNRARAVIVDVTRKLIPDGNAAKSEAFYTAADLASEGVYALALASYVQALAGNLEALKVGSAIHKAHVREWAKVFTGPHGRTGRALAELSYGWACFLAFAVSLEAISEAHALTLWGRVVSALAYTSDGQAEHLHSEDPITRALSLTASLLSQGRVYLADLKTGEAPEDTQAAQVCGWQLHRYGEEEKLTPRVGAVKVGYYSKSGGDEWAHFDPEALHEQLQRAASGQGGGALPDKGTLWANMRDRLHPAGLMRCQQEGQRLRAFWKTSTPDGLRPLLLTLRLPFDLPAYGLAGTVGTMGTDTLQTPINTGFLPVPITLFSSKVLGTVGTDKDVFSSSPPEVVQSLRGLTEKAAPLTADPSPEEDQTEGLDLWGEV